MNMNVTDTVVQDLWSLCRAGDASADSQRLVDDYLAKHKELAAMLHEGDTLTTAMPGVRLSPDAERRLLDDARGRARQKLMVMGGAIAAGALILLVALGGALILAFRGLSQ